jgi:hypothetical protein
MNIIRNRTQGLLVAETEKSYRVRTISTEANWWPKAQCRIDHPYHESQLAIHLWMGYQAWHASPEDNIETVAKISAFVPALILADMKLEAQLAAGRADWDKVFAYDVAQAGGVWLAANPHATVEQFTAKLKELIA